MGPIGMTVVSFSPLVDSVTLIYDFLEEILSKNIRGLWITWAIFLQTSIKIRSWFVTKIRIENPHYLRKLRMLRRKDFLILWLIVITNHTGGLTTNFENWQTFLLISSTVKWFLWSDLYYWNALWMRWFTHFETSWTYLIYLIRNCIRKFHYT